MQNFKIPFFMVTSICAMILCAISWFSVDRAYAFGLDVIQSNISALPDYSAELSKEKFDEQSALYREIPKGDRHMAYTVRLPKNWQRFSDKFDYSNKAEEEAQLKRRVLGKVAEYYGPSRIMGMSRFEVYAEDLEYEVTAENWAVDRLLRSGYSLQGVETLSRYHTIIEYVVFMKDTPYVVRSSVHIAGNRVIMASYYCPDAYWQKERAYQQYVIDSFTLLDPERNKNTLTKRYAFLDILEFNYPESWRLVAPNIYSIDGMEAKLVRSHDGKTLEGEIGINVFSTMLNTTLAKELSYVQEGLGFLNLKIDELIETHVDFDFGDHILYSKIEVYKAVHNRGAVQEHEYWVAILKEPQYYYIITMISPGRNYEYYSWVRNVEAFRTVAETLGPYKYSDNNQDGGGDNNLDWISDIDME